MSEEHKTFSLQNVFYTITLLITVVGVILGAYWNILQTINAQQVTMSGIEARLVVAEKQLQNRIDSEDRFAAEMRAALHEIQVGVADLRVSEAQRTGGKK
jgi:hypothetical protein